MGISYRVDTATGLSVSVWDGEVTGDQRREHMQALASDDAWGAGGLYLTDLTGVASSSVPGVDEVLDAAAAFLETLASQVGRAKWAIVAGDTFERAQRFGSYIEEEVPRLIVFNALDTACTWLGVDVLAARAVVDALREEIRSSEGTAPAQG
jgi:hypothetical protein